MLEKVKAPNYDLFSTTVNNKCCYYSNIGFVRNSIELMTCLRAIVIVKSLKDIITEKNLNLTGIATSNLQLCSFTSQSKNHKQAYTIGLASLAIIQYQKVLLELKTRNKANKNNKNNNSNINEDKRDTNKLELDKSYLSDISNEYSVTYNNLINNETTNNSNLIIAYYNIGVQQEYLKRVRNN